MTPAFERAAREAVRRLPRGHIEIMARLIAEGASASAVLDAVPVTLFREEVARVLAALGSADPREAALHLRGLAEGYEMGRAAVRVEGVWSGPSSTRVPTRATAQVLIGLVEETRRELILMTYAARSHDRLREALAAAGRRGVSITVVVETLTGAAGTLQGEEPAAAFRELPRTQIWHWPMDKRTETSSRMHAKLAVADREVLFTTSANLTQAGIGKNIEAGLLVRGGLAPVRAGEHVRELQASGILRRLY